ncbi:hypothetical protein GF323_03600 [Candidatus Woesearchaeota archaeon]|nr:hypothetical protein [Candidatus Woesearchaeota archaeon]
MRRHSSYQQQDEGLFYEKYNINGKKAGNNLQIDHSASLLLALRSHYSNKKIPKKHQQLIKDTANTICRIWKKDHFSEVIQDLCEERFSFSDLKENFSYSLAACCKGLLSANKLIPNRKWLDTANQMKATLLENSKNNFIRSFGKLKDENMDASLIALAWPFGIVRPKNRIMANTVKKMENSIAKDYKVHRYEKDMYDGWMHKKLHRKKGAGYWPLLNFWFAIYYSKVNRKKALRYFNQVLTDLSSKYIPEQIFDNNIQVSVKPLAWSHAMFVIASAKLGYIAADYHNRKT